MTTQFTSGVTNISADGTLGKLKAPAPHKYHAYFNDFDTYLASDWTITTTESGSSSASEAVTSQAGGALLITNDDADNDLDFLQLKGEGFKLSTSKSAYFSGNRKNTFKWSQNHFVMLRNFIFDEKIEK